MIRNVKVLGLALVAVFAMSAVAASAASAAEIELGASSAEIVAEQSTQHVFSVEGNNVECSGAVFKGSASNGATEVTMHPEYTGCSAFGFVEATVNTAGCNYIVSAPGTVEEGEVAGTLKLSCEEGSKITITAATCQATVEGPQTFSSGLTLANMATSPATLTLNANNVEVGVTKTKDGFLCPFNGTGAATGTYTGNTLAKAFAGEPVTQVGIAVQ